MLGIQASIGALNDIVDADVDADRKPGKPLPRGLVTPRMAGAAAFSAGAVGLGLSAPSGMPTLVVAVLGAGLGYAYDVRLSRGPLSWLPLALALPLVPIHAWLGVTGTIPPGLLPIVPAAVLAGLGLAIANALVDLERDLTGGRHGIVVVLGAERAWRLHALALTLAALLALALAPVPQVTAVPWAGVDATAVGAVLVAIRSIAVPAGVLAIAVGSIAVAASRPDRRERGWELEALGVATMGIGWVAGVAASGAA